jgi:uncharacterized protein (DUF433 family)
MEKTSPPRLLGRYIVADPAICHGKPTFRGIRIMVADVLEQVAEGLAWETIIEEWRGSITEEAITEAVSLARRALLDHVAEYIVGPTAA